MNIVNNSFSDIHGGVSRAREIEEEYGEEDEDEEEEDEEEDDEEEEDSDDQTTG